MLKELYTAALGMMPQQTRLEVIANNLSNANTAGFKKESVFERNLIDARANFYNVPGDTEQDDPPYGSYISFDSGAFQKTDNPLDIAIENSKAFFFVQDVDGNEFLTKSGNFTLNSDGAITTMDGKFLLGQDGPIKVQSEFSIDPLTTSNSQAVKITITENGEVFANETNLGHLKLVEVDNLNSLQRISNANFVVTGDTEIKFLSEEEILVRQGWLEGSNVDIIKEMVEMIELQRMYELGSRVIQTNNATLDNSIRLGRFV